MKELLDRFNLKNSIRLLIGGFLFDGGEISEVSDLLQEMAGEYKKEIDNLIEK